MEDIDFDRSKLMKLNKTKLVDVIQLSYNENLYLKQELAKFHIVRSPENLIEHVIEEDEAMCQITNVNFIRRRIGKHEYRSRNMSEVGEYVCIRLMEKYVRELYFNYLDIKNLKHSLYSNFFDKVIRKENIYIKHEGVSLLFAKGVTGIPLEGDFQLVITDEDKKLKIFNIYEAKETSSEANKRNCNNIECVQDKVAKSVIYYDIAQKAANEVSFKHGEYDVKFQYWFISNEPFKDAFYETENGVKYISYKRMSYVDESGKTVDLKSSVENHKKMYIEPQEKVKIEYSEEEEKKCKNKRTNTQWLNKFLNEFYIKLPKIKGSYD